MIYLNAGNLWDNDYLDTIIRWNEEFKDTIQVKSLFGSIKGVTPTARSSDRLPYVGKSDAAEQIDKAAQHDIAFRYTLNQSCIDSTQHFREAWDTRFKAEVITLHDVGIHEWIVTSPLLVELLRDMFPYDFIEVSTIAEVSTPEEMKRWKSLGTNGANISTSINRDFTAIRAIASTGATISILANEACLWKCPWRRDCYNLSSHDSQRSEDLFGFYPFRRCTEVRIAHPDEWIKSRLVLPQWLETYQEQAGVNWFKIAYRTHPKEVGLPILRMYMEQYHNGNLLDLWPTISPLGDTIEPRDLTHISCRRLDELRVLDYFTQHGRKCASMTCNECGYCKRIYEDICKPRGI